MAGYIFSLDSLESLNLYINNGVYATKLSTPLNLWRTHHEATFADYVTMEEGDNIYFFIKRKIYGIGKLLNLKSDCKYFNYPDASNPNQYKYEDLKKHLLWDEGEHSINQRCICIFKPDPFFFKTGIDMDDVLSSNPASFKMLRAFWKLSFIKFDDIENQAFKDIILKRNQETLRNITNKNNIFPFQPIHKKIKDRIIDKYNLTNGIKNILSSCAENDSLKHEMAIELGILHQISIKDESTCKIFGYWDYLTHQVIASPFKPVDYMDKMDLFGYSYLSNFKPTKSYYLIGEIKRDVAKPEDIDQLLKYIDWVKDEYCFGDYTMIKAFLIALNFEDGAKGHKKEVGVRKYTIGVRPARSLEWDDIKLVKYSFNEKKEVLEFDVID